MCVCVRVYRVGRAATSVVARKGRDIEEWELAEEEGVNIERNNMYIIYT